MPVRPATADDHARIVALNAAEVTQTSAMDAARLAELDVLACAHWVFEQDGKVVAFLLAMDHSAVYRNDNFDWFATHLSRFVYVDRIVVDASAAGRGIGQQLYRNLFQHARERGIDSIVCEYNLDPPNPASQAFHDRFGFREIGQQYVAGGSKRVSMQLLNLNEGTTP
ncbi:MAG: GNAT family N-acetyltransferase [Silanimonas sp.]